MFYKITYIKNGKKSRFWANDRRDFGRFVLYTPCNNEGDEFTKKVEGGYELAKKLILKNLILKEQPAYEHRVYGTLRV